MKFPHTRFGMKGDPRGAHVTLTYEGRTLLGEVRDVRYNELRGCFLLTVRYFNGEPWPIAPSSLAVDVLDRAAR